MRRRGEEEEEESNGLEEAPVDEEMAWKTHLSHGETQTSKGLSFWAFLHIYLPEILTD